MTTGKIKFNEPNDVKNFVNLVSKYDMDVDVKHGTTMLDGKSIQGLMAIQLQVELMCVLHDDISNCTDIIRDIQLYIVEDFK